jgi:nicotinate-nucleotide--dimethylbenzimidazole phosphoribosyltransferase
LATQLTEICRHIPPPDEAAMAATRARQDQLTKPPGSLGRLEELSIQLAGIAATPLPRFERKAAVVNAQRHYLPVVWRYIP